MPRSGIPATPAQLCLLSSLPCAAEPPPRVRLVGRIASWNPTSGLAVLVDVGPPSADGDPATATTGRRTTGAVLIDLTLPVLGSGQPPPRLKDQIMLTGQVTRPTEPIPDVPNLQVALAAPIRRPLDLETVIAVERFAACDDLDLEQWRAAVRAVQTVAAAGGTKGRTSRTPPRDSHATENKKVSRV